MRTGPHISRSNCGNLCFIKLSYRFPFLPRKPKIMLWIAQRIYKMLGFRVSQAIARHLEGVLEECHAHDRYCRCPIRHQVSANTIGVITLVFEPLCCAGDNEEIAPVCSIIPVCGLFAGPVGGGEKLRLHGHAGNEGDGEGHIEHAHGGQNVAAEAGCYYKLDEVPCECQGSLVDG